MARLEAQSKLLYYPTPNTILDTIATWFKAEKPVRLADPCCGTGEALQRFAAALGAQAETWGVELSYARAEEAAQALDVVLPASFYEVQWAHRSVSLAFNNPPYDWSPYTDPKTGKRIRHELLFVQGTTTKIVPGGHQVIILPRTMLGDETLARHLAGWYAQTLLFRFPDPEYAAFSQVVFLALNKRAQYEHPGHEASKP